MVTPYFHTNAFPTIQLLQLLRSYREFEFDYHLCVHVNLLTLSLSFSLFPRLPPVSLSFSLFLSLVCPSQVQLRLWTSPATATNLRSRHRVFLLLPESDETQNLQVRREGARQREREREKEREKE